MYVAEIGDYYWLTRIAVVVGQGIGIADFHIGGQEHLSEGNGNLFDEGHILQQRMWNYLDAFKFDLRLLVKARVKTFNLVKAAWILLD